LDVRILRLLATVIEVCDPPREGSPGHPPADTVRVLRSLRRFLREGTPWRSLTATAAQASGSTLRRWLTRWAEMGVLAQVHAVLVGMLRGPSGSDPGQLLGARQARG
jgi:transposase